MNRNKTIGAWGEELACKYLLGKQYKILGRNLKLSNQELDIVAFKEGMIIFVEVKTRISTSVGKADEMITRTKLKSLKVGASRYLSRNSSRFSKARFDLLALDIDRVAKSVKVRHYKGII